MTNSSKSKVRIKFVLLGIDIIDKYGEVLCGITERDAIDLYEDFKRNLSKIKKRAKQMEPTYL